MSFVKFKINGQQYMVSSVEADTSLNSFLRNALNLRGTKAMCQEGGCGTCIVSVKVTHPVTKEDEVFSVNSCLVFILSCHGWEITTVEGIGNKKAYHPIQSRLASFDGTQCGYCSPGWVMSMYSLQEANPSMTMKEVENSFAGNICRCTGYRPICDAFKSFAKDADPKIRAKIRDIEDLSSLSLCRKTGEACTKTCDDYSEDGFCLIDAEIFKEHRVLELTKEDDTKWYKVYKIQDILNVFDKEGTDSYMLVVGNTAQGVYHMKHTPKVMIDITGVSELREFSLAADLVLGSNMTLAEVMRLFLKVCNQHIYFRYTKQVYDHLDLVAHIPVRNIGSLGGNLSIKHKHPEFQSDVFLLLETVGATLTYIDHFGNKKVTSLPNYLHMDMAGQIIHSINMPPLSDDYIFESHKVMPRAQNSHAVINAGFLFKMDANRLIQRVNIVYGGVSADFIHAEETEKYLVGKNVFRNEVFSLAVQSLCDEIFPDLALPELPPEYRKKLAVGLFYKTILSICPDAMINPKYKSGGLKYDRPVSKGEQTYDTDKSKWPVNQPVRKLEGLAQCSGEAKFSNDLPTQPNEVYAAFAVSTVHDGEIDRIDSSEVLKIKGVVAVLTASDIPGLNSFTPLMPTVEEIIASSKILFYGQPLAIVVAETERIAKLAAEQVKVTYKNSGKTVPILGVRDVLASPSAKERTTVNRTVQPKEKGTDIDKVLKGSFDIYGQYHYTMETQTCVCVPIEDGLDVFPSTQWMDFTHIAIAGALGVPMNSINLNVRRLGGGYGSKISRATQVATACAVAATKLNRPVRFVMPIETNMLSIGKRYPCSNDYEIGVNKDGKIQYLRNTFYEDIGCSLNENEAPLDTVDAFVNCYEDKTWYVQSNSVLTDTPSNTWCRAPGSTEGFAMIESIMDHIATETGKDPTEIRLLNMTAEDNPLPDLIKEQKVRSDFNARQARIKTYNSENRWRKRGISISPMKYALKFFGNFASFIAVYHGDGTVAVCHAGIEMGQGINTKVAQVCARTLNIPLKMVSVKPSNNLVTPNAVVSGGSITSESCCFATLKACENLLDRLEPVRKTMTNPTWQELITKAHLSGVDLSAHHMATMLDGLTNYSIYGVTIAEVEIDVITGQHQILRVDILEDTGESLSPDIDVGQVEGAYIMGMGYYTSEKLVYDKKTGELLTTRTWNYKPPGMKDIPLDMRIEFRHNAPNPVGVLRSKATGEPPLNMAFGIVSALRQAITSARVDNGFSATDWFPLEIPCTLASIHAACNTPLDQYKLQ